MEPDVAAETEVPATGNESKGRASDEKLPRSAVAALALGHGGLSVIVNLLGLMLVFFYLPPDTAGLPQLVTDATFLVVINAVMLLAAIGRMTDAVTDPLIAVMSDRSKHRRGRRIPFMAWGALPAGVAAFALFVPPIQEVSAWNIVWLVAVQAIMYVALTSYATPAFSLVADLGTTAEERLSLATWTAATWAVGIVVAATTPFIAGVFEARGVETLQSWQIAVGVVCAIGVVGMYVPVFGIDEPRWSRSEPASVPFRQIVSIIAANPFFRYYVAADFAYFGGLMIIQTGMLFYVTVLLELDDALAAVLTLLMILVATALYPLVMSIAKKRGGKNMVITAFVLTAIDFGLVIMLGRYPIPNIAEAVIVILIFAIAFAVLSVIPQWILTDIAEHSKYATGTATAASFFAARTFLQKIAQTFGVIIFALLTTFGRDVGDDLGIRLSGVAGVALYVSAALLFRGYNEKQLRSELDEMTANSAAGLNA